MPRPTRHKLILEITDMSGTWRSTALNNVLREALKDGLHSVANGTPSAFEQSRYEALCNVRVKSTLRVQAAAKALSTKRSKKESQTL